MNIESARPWMLLAGGFACALALAGAGCDTVARISFKQRQFQEIDSPGFTATSGSCDDGLTSGAATLRFVLLADDRTPIQPGQAVARKTVALTADDLSFSQTKLFSTPDVDCGEDDVMCPASMTCSVEQDLAGDPHANEDFRRCQTEASLKVGSGQKLQFVSDIEKNQLFGVVVENSGSLEGFLPTEIRDLTAEDPDGTMYPVSASKRREAASDPNQSRKSALSILAGSWATAAANAQQDNRQTLYGLWYFAGRSADDVASAVSKASAANAVWTDQRLTADHAVDAIPEVSSDGRQANVYQAIDRVLDSYADTEYADYEKTLVVLVDGPDDLRFPNATADTTIARATALGVRVFIVQLDAAREEVSANGTLQLIDDPRYWSAQVNGDQIQTACSDGDCKNFETCAVPRKYEDTNQTGKTGYDPMGEKYCIVSRDANGRVGPIHDYARIACETGGGYIYVKHPRALSNRMKWLPFTMDGLWQIDTSVDLLQNGEVAGGDAYKLQTTMSVGLGGVSRNLSFSQAGDAIQSDNAAKDTRAVLFTAP